MKIEINHTTFMKKMKILKKILWLPVIILLLTITSNAQQINQQKFRLAQSYELNGDMKAAEDIYRELVKSNPTNDQFFFALAANLKKQNKFTDLLPLVETRMNGKATPDIVILYAELNWRTGNPQKANENWNLALKEFGKTPEIYEAVAQDQILLRLYEKAIETLKQARTKFENPSIFSDEISKLYIATGNYRDGFSEIMSMLRSSSGLATAQGRIYAFMTNKDAVNYIDSQLATMTSANREDLLIQELYAWFLRTEGKLDKAFEVYKNIDEIKHSNGGDIVNFANIAAQDGQFEIAAKAYNFIISQGKRNPFTGSALYGLTNALEQQMQNKSEYTTEEVENVINSYKKVISEFSGTQQAALSYLRIAELSSKFLRDNSAAKNTLKEFMAKFSNTPMASKAQLLLGNIFLDENSLENASQCYSNIAAGRYGATKEDVDKAKIKLADILYYTGKIDSAAVLYSQIASDPTSDAANDAMKKTAFIREFKDQNKAIELFAEADLLIEQNKTSEALAKYLESAKFGENTRLPEECYIKIAQIQFNAKNYKEATESYEKILKDFPETIYGDFICLQLGKIKLNMGDKEGATKYFTDLLSKFPDSIYVNDARELILKIRGNKI